MAWAFAVGTLVVAYVFQVSRFGLMLRASRDDEVAAKSSAVSIVMALIMIFRPAGSTRGREVPWPFPHAARRRHMRQARVS